MILRRLFTWLLVCLTVSLGSMSLAQDPVQKVFDAESWAATASRAEGIIEQAEASSPALETLRATLVKFRADALAIQDVHTPRITTLESQLAALGPAPTDGVVEAEAVASRRKELNEQLTNARAPSLAAQEAYKRANGLIGEIDAIIRERQTAKLLTLGASPLDLNLWPQAIEVLAKFTFEATSEVTTALKSEAQGVEIRQNLPLILVLLVIGLALTTRARVWALRALGFEEARQAGYLNETRALLVSATQVIVPMLGILAFLEAIDLFGVVGIRGSVVIGAIPTMALSVYGAFWIGRTLFTTDDGTPIFFNLDEKTGRRTALSSGALGILLALHTLFQALAQQADWPDAAHVVLVFPIVTLSGLLLFRLGITLDRYRRSNDVAGMSLQRQIFRLVSRSVIFVGLASPVLAAIGYFTASVSFVFPTVETLALFGTGAILFRMLNGLFEELLGGPPAPPSDEEETVARPTMLPVIVGFTLILIGIPLLALAWGARVSDLQEVWTMISDGFQLGGRRISVVDFLTFAIVFAIGYTVTRLLQSTLKTTVLPRTSLDAGGRNALVTGTGYVGVFLAALAAITSAGLDLSSLAIVAGALSVGIGFGLQAIVSNFVSGIILLIERPIKEGDWIEVGSYSGYVSKISVRSTEIETFDRATVVVPNADFISGTVINYTHSDTLGRVKVPVGVAYGSDPREVERILKEIANDHHMIDKASSPPAVIFMGFGADSMDFEIRAILRDVNWLLHVKSDMNYQIVKRFREAGIEIPFSQRDINLRNLNEIGATLKTVLNKGET